MAEILRYVDPNSTAGGNGTTNALVGDNRAYISLNAWEAATQQDLTDGAGDTARVVCSSDDAGSTHAADTTNVSINGWTTSAACFITIEAASSHGGKWNDNIYRMSITDIGSCIDTNEEFIKIVGIQFSYTMTTGGGAAVLLAAATATSLVHVDKCIVKGILSTATSCYGIRNIDADVVFKVSNCIVYGFVYGTNLHYGLNGAGSYYNCTVSNCRYGIRNQTAAVNNAHFNNYDDFYANTGVDYCASDDGDGTNAVNISPGGTEATDWAACFVDYANGDFHLKSDSVCVDAGVSDPGSGLFSDDIDGVTRTGTWDIGADEYVAVGGPIIPVFMHHYLHSMGRR